MEKEVTITEASDALQISRQAVYVAILKKRILAEKKAGRWIIESKSLQDYRDHRFCRSKSRREDGDLVYRPERGEYSARQIAEKFDVPVARLYHLMRNNRIPHYRHNAAYVIEVQDWEALRKIIFFEDLEIIA